MNSKYMVADDSTIINPQGIRFVEKVDQKPYGGEIRYRLKVTYKGNELDYQYETESDRNAQFERLRAVLGPPEIQSTDHL